MRANEFGTSPRRPDRPGSRPARGHEPVARYTLAELSDDTIQSYKEKAEKQVKELEPHAKKGEYKDIAKRMLDRRNRGLEMVRSRGLEETTRMSAAAKLQRAFEREQAKSTASRKRGEEVMAQARSDWEKKQSDKQPVAENSGLGTMPTTEYVKGIYAAAAQNGFGAPEVNAVKQQMVLAPNGEVDIMATMQKAVQVFQSPKFKQLIVDLEALVKKAEQQGTNENTLGHVMQWPEVVNNLNSAMKAMGWKGKRQSDDAFMFSTKGQETDDQWYIVIIENKGNNMFTYALGTIEEGDPHIGEQDSLPMTAASISELMNSIRDGFGLNEGKQKGVDGKACWKGYKRMGTKKKGGRTVDNCVKMEEQLADLEAQLLALSEEGKASRKLCASSKPDNELGASQLASCKSQGLRSRDGNKSHKLGKSPKSRVKVGGHKIKGAKYGGPLPDWS